MVCSKKRPSMLEEKPMQVCLHISEPPVIALRSQGKCTKPWAPGNQEVRIKPASWSQVIETLKWLETSLNSLCSMSGLSWCFRQNDLPWKCHKASLARDLPLSAVALRVEIWQFFFFSQTAVAWTCKGCAEYASPASQEPAQIRDDGCFAWKSCPPL